MLDEKPTVQSVHPCWTRDLPSRACILAGRETYRPERASLLDGDVDVQSAEELARSVGAVVVEAGAVGRVLLTREGAADGRGDARPPAHGGHSSPGERRASQVERRSRAEAAQRGTTKRGFFVR